MILKYTSKNCDFMGSAYISEMLGVFMRLFHIFLRWMCEVSQHCCPEDKSQQMTCRE